MSTTTDPTDVDIVTNPFTGVLDRHPELRDPSRWTMIGGYEFYPTEDATDLYPSSYHLARVKGNQWWIGQGFDCGRIGSISDIDREPDGGELESGPYGSFEDAWDHVDQQIKERDKGDGVWADNYLEAIAIEDEAMRRLGPVQWTPQHAIESHANFAVMLAEAIRDKSYPFSIRTLNEFCGEDMASDTCLSWVEFMVALYADVRWIVDEFNVIQKRVDGFNASGGKLPALPHLILTTTP